MKINKSIYFKDINEKNYFLFQIVNYGKSEDELKFIFNFPRAGTGIVYSLDGSRVSSGDIIKPYAEISYHSDGSILYKLPKYMENDRTDYVNPFGKGSRKTPIKELRDFEPVFKYTVVSYSLCKKIPSSEVIILPTHKYIFNGEPFECVTWLGNIIYATPENNGNNEMVYRLNDVANGIDLIIWILKSNYKGKIITIPNTDIRVFDKSNVVQIVQKI